MEFATFFMFLSQINLQLEAIVMLNALPLPYHFS